MLNTLVIMATSKPKSLFTRVAPVFLPRYNAINKLLLTGENMIETFQGLARELDGLYSVGSLRVLDSTGRLPLSRDYVGGHRVFDPVEVQTFKAAVIARRVRKA